MTRLTRFATVLALVFSLVALPACALFSGGVPQTPAQAQQDIATVAANVLQGLTKVANAANAVKQLAIDLHNQHSINDAQFASFEDAFGKYEAAMDKAEATLSAATLTADNVSATVLDIKTQVQTVIDSVKGTSNFANVIAAVLQAVADVQSLLGK